MSCPVKSNITTLNGLHFNGTCIKNFSGPGENETSEKVIASNLADCATACSTHRWFWCKSVIYDAKAASCTLFNFFPIVNTTDADTQGYVATLDASGIEPLPTDCPFENEIIYNATNGMGFDIECDRDYYGDDMDFSTLDQQDQSLALPVIHTDTMKECIETCSENRPICLGVSWNPDLSLGWPNCYPKSRNDRKSLRTVSYAIHTAMAVVEYNSSCVDNIDYISSANDKTYRTSCSQSDDSPSIDSTHAPNFESCMETCASYHVNGTSCIAVNYDGSFRNGYDNCYMKIQVAGRHSSMDYSFAELITGDGHTDVSSTSATPRTSPSVAAIAGPVTGAIAFVILASALFWWWWRRKRQAQVATGDNERASNGGGNPARDPQRRPTRPPRPTARRFELEAAPAELLASVPKRELETVERPQEIWPRTDDKYDPIGGYDRIEAPG